MKNLNTMFAAMTLMAVMVFGTTFANAGIIILSDADTPTKGTSCETNMKEGIIILGAKVVASALTGIIILGSKDDPCTQPTYGKEGIIIL